MKKLDFNQNWTLIKVGASETKVVDLPHDAMLFEPRSRDAATAGAGGYFHAGKYTYQKVFLAPNEWAGQTVILECEGVYQNATVSLNGKDIQFHAYGYTGFLMELSDQLLFGSENTLTICADNSQAPNSRWYSGSGVYREVQLYIGPKVCIAPEGLKITPLDSTRIRVDAELLGGDCGMSVQIFDGNTVVATAEQNHAVIAIPNAKLWSAESPVLYTCRVTLENGDCATEKFGIRTVSWDSQGFKVNGAVTLLRGGCVHHDNGILGACAFRDAEWRKVRILKEAGFNAIRSAHNPTSKALLDACDYYGMYVMDETFDMWLIHKNPYDYAGDAFRRDWQKDTASMVNKDYNHPSVIMYSIGNEISELGLSEGQELAKEMAAYVRALDGTRCITCGINLMLASAASKGKGVYGTDKNGKEKSTGTTAMDSLPTSTVFNALMNRMGGIIDKMAASKDADQVADAMAPILDVSGYNYATSRYQKESATHSDRVFVGSETLPKSLYKNWQLVEKLPNLVGDFMWTSWDYLGESGIGTVRYTKKGKDVEPGLIVSGGPGIIDICGNPRPEVEWGKIIWHLTDRIAIGVNPVSHADHFRATSMWRDTDAVASWSWEGFEGKKTDVVVYADAATVTLLVNGHEVGKKKVKQMKAIFKRVIYTPGILEAIAYDEAGKELARTSLSSAEGLTEIRCLCEKEVLQADGQSLCFLNIALTDAKGITKSSVDQKLTVTVEGAGSLAAFGSARPNMAESFVESTHTTYYGKALAVIRAGYTPGDITVTIQGDGLAPKTLHISVTE